MKPGQYDIEIFRGSTYRKELRLQDSLGNPIDLTGVAARMQARPYRRSRKVTFDFTPYLTIDELAGTITIDIDHAITEDIAWNQAVYDLEIEYPSSDAYRILEGTVTTDPEVTRT